jgi:alpha-tubulin suppressor-like RCC1 family protein
MKIRRFRILFTIVLVTLVSHAASQAATRARTLAETVLNDSPVRLSAGNSTESLIKGTHTCQVNDDGTVRCWGRNDFGQLGDTTTTNRPTPVLVSGLTTAVAISAGDGYTCALLANGSARCWGRNGSGQLGDTTTTDRRTPVLVSGLTTAVAISAGDGHTCALLADGRARCWGRNLSGELGDGTTTDRPTPVAVSGLTNVVAISAGGGGGLGHTCALRADGSVLCWGLTFLGVPAPVLSSGAVAVSAGTNHTCALLTDGSARCWGFNNFGALGNDGIGLFQPAPGVSVKDLTNAVAISAGFDHTCALLATGRARCWGRNDVGQLGDDSVIQKNTPVDVQDRSTAVAISAGGLHTCALLDDGSARCWGNNPTGQLGDGTTAQRHTPTPVIGGGGSVTGRGIAAGNSHTCAVRANSIVSCWGANAFGALGNGGFGIFQPTPQFVLSNAVAVAAGFAHTCALLADGTVRCWGRNDFGQLGDGSGAPQQTLPVPVVNLDNAVALAAGWAHTCALLADGSVRCWGANFSGQLGDGTGATQPLPVRVRLESFGFDVKTVALAAGDFHTCALVAGGSVRCWGYNGMGQLGDGTRLDQPIPVPVSNLDNPRVPSSTTVFAVALAAGSYHTCALLADGTARCWGYNGNGQLGDLSISDRTTPTSVFGLSNAVALAAGSFYTCAVLATGRARCWGENSSGQLGDGTTIQRVIPTEVTTVDLTGTIVVPLGGIVNIATGFRHSCAILANGAVRCWGENDSGQIGDGTLSDRLRPVLVPSF